MKAKVKSLGSVTDLSEYIYDEDGNQYTWDELELIDEDKWQHYSIQAAIAAMQAQLSSFETMESITKRAREHNLTVQEAVATLSVDYADALIAELKERKEE